MNNTENIQIIDEPTVCPQCGSTDLGVFAAAEHREDEADLVACEDCSFQAALTEEGAQSLALGLVVGDTLTIPKGVYASVYGVVHAIETDEYGTDVVIRALSGPAEILDGDPTKVTMFVHVDPTDVRA